MKFAHGASIGPPSLSESKVERGIRATADYTVAILLSSVI
jgi:hypothetical protein